MRRQKIKLIEDIKKYLKEDGTTSPKDEITIVLLENTYEQYLIASKQVKLSGQTVTVFDAKNNQKQIINPAFKNQMELQKQLLKYIENLYLTPRSRKSQKEKEEEEQNPFDDMIKSLSGEKIEKRSGEK